MEAVSQFAAVSVSSSERALLGPDGRRPGGSKRTHNAPHLKRQVTKKAPAAGDKRACSSSTDMETYNKDKDIGPLPDYAQGVQGPYAAGHRKSLGL
jgi:hypothetical protein